MEGSYNTRCPAVKRLLREARELHKATEEYFAQPLDDNLFEWHFTVRGPPDSDYDEGVYHGRIIMPPEYPMKPPNIIFLTANGRFETNKKICLSISGHHPETWQPSWSIRTALLAIIGFMPSPSIGSIGSLDYTPAERAALAKKSLKFNCTECGKVINLLKERTSDNADIQREAREVFHQMKITTKEEEKIEDDAPKSEVEQANNPSSTPTITTDADKVILSPDSSASPSQSSTNQSTTQATDSQRTPASNSSPIPVTSAAIQQSSNGSFFNTTLLTAASVLLVALIFRRLFLMELEHKDDVDDIML